VVVGRDGVEVGGTEVGRGWAAAAGAGRADGCGAAADVIEHPAAPPGKTVTAQTTAIRARSPMQSP
jgi:hypothetical protein